MQFSEQPQAISIAFANSGNKRAIPNASQIGIVDGAASYTDGFPPKTFLPLAVGGVPPSGQDFNGLLYSMTSIQRWQSAGMLFAFNADFANTTGGYPKGATLASADRSTKWISLVDNNKTNPDATDGSAANWVQGPTTFKQLGAGALELPILFKLRQRFSIDDYSDIKAAFANDKIAGAEGTGYGAAPVDFDMQGKTITFTGDIVVPINVRIINGYLKSTAGRVIYRNPFLANTGLRDYTSYWLDMNGGARGVIFDCKVIINCYIGARFEYCDFTRANSVLALVNSNDLWTEYNTFYRCTYAGNAAAGAGIIFDGNLSNTSVYSTGTGAGRADGSFGYNDFIACKSDSTQPTVGIKVLDGASWYNGEIGFKGYSRGNGPSGAFLYIVGGTNPGKVSYCHFNVHLEAFGASANIISIETGGKFWYNFGNIQSASPTMTFSQGAADLRNNYIYVTGAVLYDVNGAIISNGDTVQSKIANDLLKRTSYTSGLTEYADRFYGSTSVSSPLVFATTSLESRVPNTGDINWNPQDPRAAASRNWCGSVNTGDFGDWCLKESTTRLTLGTVIRLRVKSGGNVVPGADNTQTIGEAANRWAQFFAGTGTINTSDERLKTDIEPINVKVLRAWSKVEFCMFKFKDAVEQKGDGARWHFGVIAQRVKEAFESEGLDPFAYGILCYDEWESKPEVRDDVSGAVTMAAQSAGNRYGVRYEEALVLECAYLRSKIN